MTARHAPVTLGSPHAERIATPSVEVVSAWFPPHARLDSHSHARPIFGLMLSGAFRTSILHREVDYDPNSAWSEPAEERHTNLASARGAQVLIIQPAIGDGDLGALHRVLFDEVVHIGASDLMSDASRLAVECAQPDDLSPLVADGLALAMLARAARIYRTDKYHKRAPAWLQQAVDYLHAHFLERCQLGDVARAAGVHPSRLAHEFRAHHRCTPGDYLRGLRLQWASEQLSEASLTIADVALRAGFYDQSHFSRMFRRRFGVTPDAWRKSRK